MVSPLTIQRRLQTSFDNQHVKRFKTLVESSSDYFYHIFLSLWEDIIWKISPWLKVEIIELFVKPWTADYKYPLPDCENLLLPIQIQLPSKQKTFSGCFIAFKEFHQILNIFKKKKIVIANVYPKLSTV